MIVNMSSIKTFVKSGVDFIKSNSSTVLTAMSVVGTISAVIMAVKATPKAIADLDEDKEDRASKLKNPSEVKIGITDCIRVCWKTYLPTVLMTGLSAGCAISAQTINLKRQATLMALYSAAAGSLKEYKDKTAELLGEAKLTKVREAIDKDHIDENPVTSREVCDTGYGEYLCYDTLTGRYFKHSIEGVRKCVNDLNAAILNNGYITLNEFYYTLGLDQVKFGDEMGWNTNHRIDVDFSTQQAADGRPCLVVDYVTGPIYDFDPF